MMDDLISRQAAIDALHTWFRDGFDEDKWWNSTHVLAAIEGLHPVQQEHKWETCFECPLSHGCPKIKGCTNEQAIEYASQIPNDCPLSAQPEPQWIPVSERLPEDLSEVNVTWVNHNPELYYESTKDKPFTATAVYYKGKWYWWSTYTQDLLAEYGEMCNVGLLHEAIEVTAWMPLPEPYKPNKKQNGKEGE